MKIYAVAVGAHEWYGQDSFWTTKEAALMRATELSTACFEPWYVECWEVGIPNTKCEYFHLEEFEPENLQK